MTLLTVSNLSKRYDSKPVVNNVSFSIDSGKCIALIGPNGAGKTTILRTLAGLLHSTSGSFQLGDMKTTGDIRKYIGYLPQHPVFYSWMTGREFLVYSGELALLSKTDANNRADELLDKVGIFDAKDKRIGKYSGGMKQRLGIAQALIHKPELLLLDEPVSSLDPIGRREILTMMEELKEEMSILFSTHILSDADEVSDELLLLHQGEIVESGSMNTLRQKYQTAKIELEFQSDIGKYKDKIDQLSAITNSYIDRNVLHVTATDILKARQEIFTAASGGYWPLTSFTLNRASLEDMFMKVVNT
ncbi:ABC-2 type transport system ATP-binding protein [Virgibacillus natechei]|uniref:ABC-2 type transport system ATP-binding protein n=1 Tax=Virgibacillus natechei TaxID=1216297 RepID=A0ABS4II12_9BACI|nr:ABC transporter ATP-binding protein [Virgibacillus natechei]MBP1970594.1 ABC-2 type transport system ATP-binding protein [Virgibacillus natechei]UZD14009.1 ABC transporter ATP-binding protein [Virgibacillus natechei]